MDTIWKYKEIENKLANRKDLSRLMQQILSDRGITEKEADNFLSGKPKDTFEPLLMKNMDEVSDLIIDSINEDKKVCVYGDYDVDGISSVSLLTQVLKNLAEDVSYYIPSRFDEGYGLNKEALKYLKDTGTDLVITVDCGTVSIEEVRYCREIGLDIIITDHHTVGEELPDCLLLNPKQEDCEYPFKEICGCGVAFKLGQVIQRKAGLSKDILREVLDLLALATIADIVPLVSENRAFAKYGLAEINKGKRKSIKTLIEKVGLKGKEIDAYEVAFILAPHLNAAGRLDSAYAAANLLTSNDPLEIEENANKLVEFNQERKEIQEKGFQKCKEIVETNYAEDAFLVIDLEDVNEGVTGIIAGKIKELYHKPTIIVTASKEEGLLKGTGRSIDDVNLYDEMKKNKECFVKFGGHAKACGFSMESHKLDDFRKNMNEQMEKVRATNPEYFVKTISIDEKADVTEMSKTFIRELELLKPFGYQNERPLFSLHGLIAKKIYYIGASKNHVKTVFVDGNKQEIAAIGFNMADQFDISDYNAYTYDVVGYPQINVWNNKESIQFMIKDVKKR